MSVAGGREVHEGNGGAGDVVVPSGQLMVRRRCVGGATHIVLLRGRLQMRLHDYRFLASGGLSATDIIDGTLLREEILVRHGHGRRGLLSRVLAVDLALRQPVLLQEEHVAPLFLLRLLEHRQRRRRRLHLRQAAWKCACACSMVKSAYTGGAEAGAESPEPPSIMVSSLLSKTLGGLVGKLASVRLARRLSQVVVKGGHRVLHLRR